MTKDIEHFFVSVVFLNLLLRIPCLDMYAIFKIGLLGLLMPNFLSSLYILGVSPLSDVWWMEIFSHYIGYLFVLLTVSFAI